MIKIGIVEDKDIVREPLNKLLNSVENFECIFAFPSAELAIKDMNNGKVPDVILLDIELDGKINGVDAIPYFKNISKDIRIIMLTDFDDNTHVYNAFCHGAIGYLIKGDSLNNITEHINVVMNNGAVMTPNIASKVLKQFSEYNDPKKDYGLTEQETTVLRLLVSGINKKMIAEKLFISPHTVGEHLKHIYEKLQVHSQIDVTAKAIREKLI